jgi:phosphate starvation-inducible PhoH-like protein
LASNEKITTSLKKALQGNGVVLKPKQKEYNKTIKNNILTVCHGPAGTSKTFLFCYTALHMLAEKKIEKIILTKPIQESGENLGHLPGTVEEKVEPFMKSYISNFEKIVDKFIIDQLITQEYIIVEPLAYMRGSTYDNSLMALDEAQNSSFKQLMLWVTRIGKDSKAVMMGDTSQYDIKEKDAKFTNFIEMVGDVKDVSQFMFTKEDIVRNKFLIDIVDRYEKYKLKESKK